MKCYFCGKKAEKTASVQRTLHRLPLKNADELQRWLVNVKLEDKQLLPSDRICSEHFTQDCVINDGVKITLRTGSVPTLFTSEHNCTKCVFCKSERSAKCSRTFHKFPIGNSTELLKWLSAMPLKDFVPKKSDLLCSDHFDPKYFRWNRNALRLKPNAVPTIFVPQLIAVSESHVSALQNDANEKQATIASTCEPIGSANTGEAQVMEITASTTVGTVNMADAEMDVTYSNVGNASENREQSNSTLEISGLPSSVQYVEKCTAPLLLDSPTPTISKIIHQEHHYYNSPRTLMQQLRAARIKIKKLKEEQKKSRARIKRLQTKVTSVKDIVRVLQKNASVSESGLACLQSIADSDVSDFLQRYANNVAKTKQPQGLRKTCKNQKISGITRERYPPSLRAFALTLHFHSPKAYV